MNAPTQNDAAALLGHLQASGQTETLCQPYLQFATTLLHKTQFVTDVAAIREQVGLTGRSDYFVICDVQQHGEVVRRAWIWECKAPQASIFEVENKGRLRPTKDLISAENQLLWYCDELRGNAHWKNKWGITHDDNVQIGGIIIGRDAHIYSDPSSLLDVANLKALGRAATRIRDRAFHGPAGIVVHSWDRIYEKILEDAKKGARISAAPGGMTTP